MLEMASVDLMAGSKDSTSLILAKSNELVPLFSRALESVRDDAKDSPYLLEALRVLPVGGYRSAIGSVWNAVVDDLRNKILHRSVELFNKAVALPRKVETYEDFQNHVSDDQLIVRYYARESSQAYTIGRGAC